MITSRIQ